MRKEKEDRRKYEEELAKHEEERQHRAEELRHKEEDARRKDEEDRRHEWEDRHRGQKYESSSHYSDYTTYETEESLPRTEERYTIKYDDDEDEDYQVGQPVYHSWSEDEDESYFSDHGFGAGFDEGVDYGFHSEFTPTVSYYNDDNDNDDDENAVETTPLFLSTAAQMYLDATVTKFL